MNRVDAWRMVQPRAAELGMISAGGQVADAVRSSLDKHFPLPFFNAGRLLPSKAQGGQASKAHVYPVRSVAELGNVEGGVVGHFLFNVGRVGASTAAGKRCRPDIAGGAVYSRQRRAV